MTGKLHMGFWLISLTIHAAIVAQDPEFLFYGEEELLYNEESTEVSVELFERYADLKNNPLNINCVTPDQLAETGLLSPFQIHILIQYRARYGDLYSLYELASLSGFRLPWLQKIAPYFKVEPCSGISYKSKSKHAIILNLGKAFPVLDTSYFGSPLRTDLRIKSQLGNSLSMGFTYEKDAGEQFLYEKKPEYLTAYIQYRGHRHLKEVILGNYQLHQGLGLVNGIGFNHSAAAYLLNRSTMMRIRPYSSKVESMYERGVSLRLGMGSFKLLTWASYRKQDLSTAKLNTEPNEIDWREVFRESGLHRTKSEKSGRDLGYRMHSGIQSLYRYKKLELGLLVGLESTGLTKAGLEGLGIKGEKKLNSHLSLHGNLYGGAWRLFGEFALSKGKATALFAGVTWNLNDFIQGVLLLHHYGIEYRGGSPSSYAFGSHINNEMGVSMHLQLEPGERILAHLVTELVHFPNPRHLCSVPSSGYRSALTFQNSGTALIGWRVKFSQKIWQSTPAKLRTGLRPIQTHENRRCDVRLNYNGRFQWQSRLLFSFGSSFRNLYPGYAIAQQVRIQAGQSLRTALQFVVFEVKEWDHRIYLHEPGLYYDFSFPVCYGSGQKVVLTLSLKAIQKLSIAGKLALTTYHKQDSTDFENNLNQGKEKWKLSFQLRLNL